jgi:hypothetical protein
MRACILVAKEGGESATSAAERRHWEGCASSECGLTRAFASPLVACKQFASDDTDHIPGTATSRQAPSSIPLRRGSLLHPGGSGTQQWQLGLRQSLSGKRDPSKMSCRHPFIEDKPQEARPEVPSGPYLYSYLQNIPTPPRR